MPKTHANELSTLITPELVTYLGEGTFNPNQLARSIDYSGLEIDDFDQLKKLHFVLYDDVVEYIEKLPTRLRRINIEQRQVQEIVQGEVRGPIDWKQTIAQRSVLGYDNRTLFVINNPDIEIDTPENRVVKKLLAAIAEPLTEDIESIDQDWRSAWDDADIIRLQQTLAQNVYLNELAKAGEIDLTDRDLYAARRSRQQLYSEGARLYRLYDDLLNDRFHRKDVQNLLRETIIMPIRDYRLFELFCIFAVIKRLQDLYPVKLQPILPGADEIALLEGPHESISVFYDEGGPIDFFEGYPDSTDLAQNEVPEMLQRQVRALEDHEHFVRRFLNRETRHSFFRGRPDFLIIRRTNEEQELQDVIVGEIKYSQRQSKFSQGLRELLEYIYFAKENDEFLFDSDDEPKNVYGVLCTDDAETTVDKSEFIHHWPTSTLFQSFK